jgi:hypothetical protein
MATLAPGLPAALPPGVLAAMLDWLGSWASLFTLSLHGDTVLLLAAAAGFAAVRVANHRSPRTGFRLAWRDPFQWAEVAFFGALLARGLLG